MAVITQERFVINSLGETFLGNQSVSPDQLTGKHVKLDKVMMQIQQANNARFVNVL